MGQITTFNKLDGKFDAAEFKTFVDSLPDMPKQEAEKFDKEIEELLKD